MKQDDTERENWIDMMRGFCMMAILYFHTEMYYAGTDVTPYACYVDNVLAAFFFLSGYLLCRSRRTDVSYRLRRILSTLVVPYFVFSLVFLVPKAVANGRTAELWTLLLQVFAGQASWFVPALVVSEVLFVVLLSQCRGRTALVALYGLVCLVAAAVFGNQESPLCNVYNFWHVNEVLLGSFFMALGYVVRAGRARLALSGRQWAAVALALLVLLVAGKAFILSGGQKMVFGPVIVSCFPLFVADNVVAVLLLAMVFRRLPAVRPLCWLGRHSLVLYFVCGAVPMAVSRLFGAAGLAYGGRLSLLPVYVVVVLLASLVARLVYRHLPWAVGRRFPLLLCLCMGWAVAGMAQLPPVQLPPALKAGDTVAIVSPSSAPEAEVVERGCATLRQWGYVPVVGRNALHEYHGFAGTADERAADLRWALEEPSVRAVMCSRGGDGAVQVLQRVPLEVFARHPKWLIGFSDATALHSAQVAAGVMSIHGSMCEGIADREEKGDRDSVNLLLRRLLRDTLPSYTVPHHPLDQPGEATGRLVGGNMSVFCGLAGSDYDFLNRADEGLILFIEDTNESMSKVDRMLHLLEIRGILSQLKGIVVGHFSKYKSPENGFKDMYDMLHEYLQHYPFPVCYDFPAGHHSRLNYPLVEGCPVRLRVTPEGTTLDFIGQESSCH